VQDTGNLDRYGEQGQTSSHGAHVLDVRHAVLVGLPLVGLGRDDVGLPEVHHFFSFSASSWYREPIRARFSRLFKYTSSSMLPSVMNLQRCTGDFWPGR